MPGTPRPARERESGMTARRRKNAGEKDLPYRKPGRPTLDITQQEIAQRELTTAFELLKAGGDPIAIYVLTMAAFHVATGEARRLKRVTPWETYVQAIPAEYQRSYHDRMLGHFNSMKHGGLGDLKDFMPDVVHVYLMLAMGTFWAAFEVEPAGLQDLRQWIDQNIPENLRGSYDENPATLQGDGA